MEIVRLKPGDEELVLAGAALFDAPPVRTATEAFLAASGHHLLVALEEGRTVGFVSGIEMLHPDKGREMFLYELGVDEAFRKRGIGTALVSALADLAREQDCYGMWVGTEAENAAALATYRAAGAGPPEEFVTLAWTFSP